MLHSRRLVLRPQARSPKPEARSPKLHDAQQKVAVPSGVQGVDGQDPHLGVFLEDFGSRVQGTWRFYLRRGFRGLRSTGVISALNLQVEDSWFQAKNRPGFEQGFSLWTLRPGSLHLLGCYEQAIFFATSPTSDKPQTLNPKP